MNIGQWVGRQRLDTGGRVTEELDGKLHLVDSMVAGDVVTRCGNRMVRTNEAGRLTPRYGELPEADTCQQCSGKSTPQEQTVVDVSGEEAPAT